MRRLLQRLGFITTALMLLLANMGGIAQAAGDVTLYTSYPGISVAPGQSVDFPIDVINNSGSLQRVTLSLTETPKDWKTQITGGSWVINDVLVQPNQQESIRLETNVPADIPEGNYGLTLQGTSSGGTSTLRLSVHVTKQGAEQSAFVSQYPELQGPSGATYTFRVSLSNRTGEKQLYALGADAPEGWQVAFKPSYDDKSIASISLDANGSQDIDVTVTPPDKVKAGTYKIPIHAASPANSVSTDLTVNITGTYNLSVSTDTGRLNATTTAGRSSTVNLVVTNNGSADISNIKLDATLPANWKMTFDPEQIDALKAGETKKVTATITPDGKAIAGDYVASVSASSQQASANADLRVAVHTSILWGWIGVLIVIIVFAGLFYLFRKYGRR